MMKRLASFAALFALTVSAYADFGAPPSYYTGVVYGGNPSYINVTDARFGAKCDVLEQLNSSGTSTTVSSLVITTGSVQFKVGQHLVVQGIGHVAGANDIFVNGNFTTAGGAMAGYLAGDTITLTDGMVLKVKAVSGGAVTAYQITTYAGHSSTVTSIAQFSTSGAGVNFVLNTNQNRSWAGPTLSGVITAVGGSAGSYTATIGTPDVANMTVGVAQSPVLDLYAGSDDASAINNALTTAITYVGTGGPVVFVPASSGGGCGFASTINLPNGSFQGSNNPFLVGSGKYNTDLYALAPMTKGIVRSFNSSVGYGGGLTHMNIESGGLITSVCVQIAGVRYFWAEDLAVSDCYGTAVTAGIELGDGTNYTNMTAIGLEAQQAQYSSFAQYPTYAIYIPSGSFTDSSLFNTEASGAQTADLYIGGQSIHFSQIHTWNNSAPASAATYGIDLVNSDDTISEAQLDQLSSATSAVFVNGNNDSLSDIQMHCPASSTILASNGIEIASGSVGVTISNPTATSACGLAAANVVVFDSPVSATNQAVNVARGANSQILTAPVLFALSTGFPTAPTANGVGVEGTSAVNGLLLGGEGSTYDVTLLNKNNSTACGVATGTTQMSCNAIQGITAGTYRLNGTATSATNPALSPIQSDTKSGIGAFSAGGVSFICDIATVATECGRFDTAGLFTAFLGESLNGGHTITGVGNITANTGTGYQLTDASANCTTPTLIPNRGSTNTGVGGTSSNLCFIDAGVDEMDFGATSTATWTIPSGAHVTLADATVKMTALGSGTVANMLCDTSAGLVINCTAAGTGQSTVASPTAPNSTAVFKMQGLAGAITPARTGRIYFQISATATSTTTTALDGINIQASWGTGTAPTSNAALTGTQCGAVSEYTNPTTVVAADVHSYIAASCVVTGLTIGTALWLDLAAESVNTASAVALSNVNISAIEE